MASILDGSATTQAVTIQTLARHGGELITTVQAQGTRTLILSEPSVVRIQATPDVVLHYERQGEDLILHMRDGSTVVCKNYFAEQDGYHSELLFDDGKHPPVHAVFPSNETLAVSAPGLTPEYQAVESIEPLLIGDSNHMAIWGSILGAAALGGVIAAAGSGGGGGGDNNDRGSDGGGNNGSNGTIKLNTLSGDGMLNAEEAQNALVISGQTLNVAPGTTVTVTINGKTYTTTVGADNTWSLTVPAADVQAFPDGPLPVRVTTTDTAGHTISAESSLDVAAEFLPDPQIAPVFGDDMLVLTESQGSQTISGTTGITGDGQSAVVIINNVSYPVEVDSQGNWSLTLTPEQLSTLPQGELPISVIVTDAAGNTGSNTIIATVDTIPPPVTVEALTGDNLVNAIESKLPIEIKGTSEPGAQITVNYNNQQYTTTTDADGNWSVQIPANALDGMANGNYPLTVTAKDAAGNTGTTSETVTMALTPPVPTLNTPFGDDLLNNNDTKVTQLLTGKTGAFGESQGVIINIGGLDVLNHATPVRGSDGKWTLNVDPVAGGNNYLATVDENGNWQLALPPEVLQQFADGEITITVVAVDGAGNFGAAPQQTFEVDTTPPTLAVTPVTGDDIITAQESGADVVVSGTSSGLESGQSVDVLINGVTYVTTAGPDGSWSVTIPAGNVQTLPQGDVPISVSASDAAGNRGNVVSTITVDTEVTLTVSPVATDDIINSLEITGDVPVSGTASVEDAGQTVTVTLNGLDYTTTVQPDGSWTVNLPAAALQALGDGQQPLTVSLTDAAGNSITVSHPVTIDADAATLPVISINTLSGDGYLNAFEHTQPLLLSGTSTNVEAGQTVTLTLNGKTYTAITQSDGSWSVEVPAADVLLLTDQQWTVSASVTDTSGNPANASSDLTVVAQTNPTISVDPIATDNIINATEKGSDLTITGDTTRVEAGQPVTVLFNGVTYDAQVGSDGSWSVTIPAAALSGLNDGSLNVVAGSQDIAGNQVSVGQAVTVDTSVTLAIDTIAVDDIISDAESQSDVTISGTASDADAGRTVTVTLGGNTYNATVQPDGTWSLDVPAADVQALADDTLVVTASLTDAAGNTVSVDRPVTLDTTAPVVTINPIAVNDIVSQAEAGALVTLSGTAEANSSVVITIGSLTFNATTNASGVWTTDVSLAALADGDYTANVVATDAAGNSGSNSRPFEMLATPPAPTVEALPFGNAFLSQAESQTDQIVTGTTGTANPASVEVVINGITYTATFDASGNWQITVPAADLQAMPADGSQIPITVTVTDTAGNTGSGDNSFSVDFVPPSLTVNDVTGDNLINPTEAAGVIAVSGTSDPGSVITFTLNGENYGPVTTAGNGNWSINIPAGQLASLADDVYDMVVTAEDDAGNTVTETVPLTIDFTAPVITINEPLALDGYISQAEAQSGVTITGTGEANLPLTLTLNGVPYNTTVLANGTWSVQLPASALGTIPNGDYTLSATQTDAAGNSGSDTAPISVLRTLPAPTITLVYGDGFLSQAEAQTEQTITGTTGLSAGALVKTATVTIGGVGYTPVINSDGTWSVTLTPEQLQALPQGSVPIRVDVTDVAGNAGSRQTFSTVDTVIPTIDVSPVTGDDIIDQTEIAGGGLVISGDSEPGAQVTVVFGNETLTTTVLGDGSWSVAISPDALAQPEGSYTLDISSRDDAGNEVSTQHTVQLQNGVPQPALMALFAEPLLASDMALTGTDGNDYFILNSLDFSRIDGGAGVDTLTLGEKLPTLNLAQLGFKVAHIDVLDLGTSGKGSLTLDLDNALNLKDDPHEPLRITGKNGGEVTLLNTPEGIWSVSGFETIGDRVFEVYHNSALGAANTLGDLLIQENVHVKLM
ncbi:Ig-like domain-containing protein [Cronobacter malonaticus]|uniref:Ig-like domain-containing protein n=1 Tax=Cronobacter malonaticus TaxID=413503 RepID=UPI000CFB44A1|nr:Ig-like domain-containing protein [Cronobacter malonaticus]EKY3233599.1 Ig-like domain-containing protein [Cronobacter malonaticus]ELY4027572.1 Ig-like domain-containing protein [Cronobacter malonaticus]MDI7685780.1 Ig-like domain-containing protein [Cronobacter malonaticus]